MFNVPNLTVPPYVASELLGFASLPRELYGILHGANDHDGFPWHGYHLPDRGLYGESACRRKISSRIMIIIKSKIRMNATTDSISRHAGLTAAFQQYVGTCPRANTHRSTIVRLLTPTFLESASLLCTPPRVTFHLLACRHSSCMFWDIHRHFARRL